jgi:hypothetical protein
LNRDVFIFPWRWNDLEFHVGASRSPIIGSNIGPLISRLGTWQIQKWLKPTLQNL